MTKDISEKFGKVRKRKKLVSEGFRKEIYLSEATPEHTLTIRQAHKKLENIGFDYTEKSVNNWCYPTASKDAILNCARDGYGNILITPASINARIEEVRRNRLKKQAETRSSEIFENPSEDFGRASERFGKEGPGFGKAQKTPESDFERLEGLEQENLDLRITNKGKDEIIKFLKNERGSVLQQTVELARTIGQLETKLKSLEGPKNIEQEKSQGVIEGQGERL